VKARKTSGGRKMPVRHTIPLGIVIFLVFMGIVNLFGFIDYNNILNLFTLRNRS